MSDWDVQIKRPTECPFCKAKAIDTLAKVLTATTFWHCRRCDSGWTIAGLSRSGALERLSPR